MGRNAKKKPDSSTAHNWTSYEAIVLDDEIKKNPNVKPSELIKVEGLKTIPLKAIQSRFYSRKKNLAKDTIAVSVPMPQSPSPISSTAPFFGSTPLTPSKNGT